jgi:hypothetical protein
MGGQTSRNIDWSDATDEQKADFETHLRSCLQTAIDQDWPHFYLFGKATRAYSEQKGYTIKPTPEVILKHAKELLPYSFTIGFYPCVIWRVFTPACADS